MQDLVSDLPPTIWFGSVNTTVKGEAMHVELALNSRSAYDLAYWINSLETSGAYSGVTVGSISTSDSDEGRVFSTPVSFGYTYK